MLRRVSHAQQDSLKAELDSMEQQNIIAKATELTDWDSSIVLLQEIIKLEFAFILQISTGHSETTVLVTHSIRCKSKNKWHQLIFFQ